MKWDLDSHTSSRSLTHPAGNLNNKPAARNDHTTQPETEPALNRFALKPLVLPADPADEIEHLAQLHTSGALTDDEFATAKAKILGT
jgi:hypothetical protein